ncbi:MAG: hypothetical protein ACUZ8E_04595 [Candidatus Anammoxibacter sp.]
MNCNKKNLFILILAVLLVICGEEVARAVEEGESNSTGIPIAGKNAIGDEKGTWERNPFLTIEEIESLLKPEAFSVDPSLEEVEEFETVSVVEGAALPVLTVTSIIANGVVNVAIINDQVVKVGDMVAREEVVAINKDNIVLVYNGKKRIVRPIQPSIHIELKESVHEKNE